MANVKLKLLHVLDLLLNTDEQHTINATQIVKALSKIYGITTERKSVCRDIATLQTYGHDIIADRDKRKGWYYGKRRFSPWQIRIFLDAIASTPFISRNDCRTLSNELVKDFGPNDKRMFSELMPTIYNNRKAINNKLKLALSEIMQAIAWERAVEFQLYTYNKVFKSVMRRGSKVYKVDPYSLAWINSNYYLIGIKEGETELRYFRLDRISNAHMTGTPRRDAKELLGMDLKKALQIFTQEIFHSESDRTYKEVVIRFKDEGLANMLVDKFGLPVSVEEKNGCIYATFKDFEYTSSTRTWLLSYSSLFAVTAPQDLIEAVKADLNKGLANYGSAEGVEADVDHIVGAPKSTVGVILEEAAQDADYDENAEDYVTIEDNAPCICCDGDEEDDDFDTDSQDDLDEDEEDDDQE